jgi:hypothetical protein
MFALESLGMRRAAEFLDEPGDGPRAQGFLRAAGVAQNDGGEAEGGEKDLAVGARHDVSAEMGREAEFRGRLPPATALFTGYNAAGYCFS